MLLPRILARMKQAHQRTIVGKRSNVASLVPVAKGASVGQIVVRRRAPVFFADDVVDLATQRGIVFVQLAILAAKPCPLGHLLPQGSADARGTHAASR